jgi:hypothetical protein
MPLGTLAASISGASGFPEDQVRVLLCLLLAYPIALLHRRVPGGPRARSALSAAVGVSFAVFTLGGAAVHSLASTAAAYALLRALPPRIAAPAVIALSMVRGGGRGGLRAVFFLFVC